MDFKNQVENLKLLIASVEADIGRKVENKLTAQTTEAWLLTLRKRVEEVEEDTGEALEKRRELVKLLVVQIKVNRNEDGHTQVQITYRFGPPPEEPENVYGVQHSREYGKTKPVSRSAISVCGLRDARLTGAGSKNNRRVGRLLEENVTRA